jgi:YesN/AraC family two-component response regulator
VEISSSARGKTILIVEDSTFEQRMLADMLSEHNYLVSSAYNGRQGYELALSTRPDLILLDIRMPYMDGFTACRLLKANPVTASIPIIFLSGADSEADRITGLQVGGVDFVGKPFSAGELAARIQVHLNLMPRQGLRLLPAAAGAAVADADAVLVSAAQRLIGARLSDMPTLDEIADKVGTYREKLSQLFRQHTGLTVFGYIREQRIERGAQMLRDTDIAVGDVALLVGFNNAGNFATAFRGRMGIAPSAYRSQHKAGPA